MKWLLISLFVGFMPLAAFQAGKVSKWTILPLIHPNARLILGVDWRRVLESPFGPLVRKQVELGGHPLLNFLGSIDNVDRLLVSSPGLTEEGKKPLLVIGEGRFSLAKVRSMAVADGAIVKRYNDVELLVPPNATPDDLHFALLDGQTILLGDGISVKTAIDRWQRTDSSHEDNPLYARVITLSTNDEIWAVIDDPSIALAGLNISRTALAEQVEHLELAMSISQSLNTKITIRAADLDAVKQLSLGLPALLQLAAITFSNQPSLTEAAKRLKVATEDKFLRMGLTLERPLLDKMLAEVRIAAAPEPKAIITGPPKSPSSTLPALAAPVAPPRNTVRIIGAEGGDREIPYEPKKSIDPAPSPDPSPPSTPAGTPIQGIRRVSPAIDR